MARIFVVGGDAVLAAVLEDHAHQLGHSIRTLPASDEVVSKIADKGGELIVLGLPFDTGSGPALTLALRKSLRTRSIPILAVSDLERDPDRVPTLRAGADDFLGKPWEVEELLLRIDRLMGNAGAEEPVLQGDLTSHPLWEVLQYLSQSRKTGDLMVSGKAGAGSLSFFEGRVAAGDWRGLTGSEAVLTMLSAKRGRFHFDSRRHSGKPPIGTLSVDQMLLDSAWLEDELGRLEEHLPPTGVPLEICGPFPTLIDAQFAALGIPEIYDQIERRTGTRIYDLLATFRLAPQKLRLSVAWLVSQNAVRPVPADLPEAPATTTELDQSVILDAAIESLADAAKASGASSSTLTFLVLAEADAWADLVNLVERAPGARQSGRLLGFIEKLSLRRGGSVTFEAEAAMVSLHLQALDDAARTPIEAIIPICSGLLIWLDDDQAPEAIERVKRLVDTAREGGGIVIAPTAKSQAKAKRLVDAGERWQVSEYNPVSLLGVLRLLYPHKASS